MNRINSALSLSQSCKLHHTITPSSSHNSKARGMFHVWKCNSLFQEIFRQNFEEAIKLCFQNEILLTH